MSKVVKLDVNGNVIDDDVRTLKDGQRLRVNVILMDHATAFTDAERAAILDGARPIVTDRGRHSPGGMIISDADRDAKEKILEARDKRLTSAWANPPAVANRIKPTAPAALDSEAAALRRDARLRSAWQGAV